MSAKVVLLRPDRAGDALKTLPSLRALLAIRPDLEISVVCSPHNQSLLETEPNIKLHVGSAPAEERYDIAVNLLCDHFPEAELLLEKTNAAKKFSVGLKNIHLPNETPAGIDERKNIATIIAQSVEPRVLEIWQNFPAIPRLTFSDEAEAASYLGTKSGFWIAVCPFASTVRRTAPTETWKQFCRKLFKDTSVDRFFVVTDPKSHPIAEDLVALAPARVSLIQATSFRALGAYLKRMDRVVAVDSGPLHYARALGIPVLAVASGGDYKRWHVPALKQNALIKRGLFTSHPTAWEIWFKYRTWIRK